VKKYDIAVLIPCHNEECAIAKVIEDFRAALPDARIYVGNNASTDKTAEIAKSKSVALITETRKGKGFMLRKMFSDIEAEIYVMVDGDATYDAKAAPVLIEHLIDNSYDYVNAARVTSQDSAYRSGHRFGNFMFSKMIEVFFGKNFTDILSGYKVFNRRFVKSFPCLSDNFEIETELAIYALSEKLPIGEVKTNYVSRPEGSHSKLSTYKDGIKILSLIFYLIKTEKPMLFFTTLSLISALIAIILTIPLFITFFETGLVPKMPTAILVMGIYTISFVLFITGIILDSFSNAQKELRRINYLNLAPLVKK